MTRHQAVIFIQATSALLPLRPERNDGRSAAWGLVMEGCMGVVFALHRSTHCRPPLHRVAAENVSARHLSEVRVDAYPRAPVSRLDLAGAQPGVAIILSRVRCAYPCDVGRPS